MLSSTFQLARILGLLLVLFPTLGAAWAKAQAGQADEPENPNVAVVVAIEQELTRGSLSLVGRALEEAARRGAVCVLELDTPGGRVDLMRQLGALLEDARSERGTHVVAWVKNEAMSAGAFVALHCDQIAMRDGTRIGAATPILAGPLGAMPVENKMVAALRSEFRAAAEKNGYPSAIAEGMVDGQLEVSWVQVPSDPEPRAVTADELERLRAQGPGVRVLERIGSADQPIALTAREAIQYGLASPAETLDDVLGSLVPEFYWEPPEVLRVEPMAAEWLAQVLGTLGPFLLILGVALVWIEFQAPGIGFPAAGAAVCFGLLLAGRYIAGLAGFEHVVMIVGGLVLIALELFVFPGTFWAGISGGLLLIGGLVLSATGDIQPFSVEIDRYILLQAAFSTALWLFFAALLSATFSYLLPKTPLYSVLAVAPTEDGEAFGGALGSSAGARPDAGLVGRRARATTALRPVGRVHVDGEGQVDFEAWALDGSHDAGTVLRVVGAEAGRLRVERDDSGSDPEVRA